MSNYPDLFSLDDLLCFNREDTNKMRSIIKEFFKKDFSMRELRGYWVDKQIDELVNCIFKLADKISLRARLFDGELYKFLYLMCRTLAYEKKQVRMLHKEYLAEYKMIRETLLQLTKNINKNGKILLSEMNKPVELLGDVIQIDMGVRKFIKWSKPFIEEFEEKSKGFLITVNNFIKWHRRFATHADAFMVDSQYFLRTILKNKRRETIDALAKCFVYYGYDDDLFDEINARFIREGQYGRYKVIKDRINKLCKDPKSKMYLEYEMFIEFEFDLRDGEYF